jgi:integrase
MSVHKEPKTGKWFVRFRTPDGKNRQKTFSKKVDADRYDREKRIAIERGNWSDPSGAKIKVTELYEMYSATKLGLKPKSIDSNKSLWSYHLEPKFGNTSIGAINVREVHKWMQASVVGDSAYTTSGRIEKALKLLASMLDYAVDLNYIAKNPLRKSNGQVNKIKVPQNDRTRVMIALTPEELMTLAPLCQPYETMVLIAGLCGLRWAEVIGLQAQDIDIDGKYIEVKRSLSEVSGNFHESTTKNGRERVVQVPQFLHEKLQLAVIGKHSTDLVFTNRVGKPISSSNFKSRTFEPAIKAAGIPRITFHDLRHTAASCAISMGANILVVSKMLGHSDPSVTLNYYGHMYQEDQMKLAQDIDAWYTKLAIQ